jgi:hypothetical protein
MSRFLQDIQQAGFLLTSDHPNQYFEQVNRAIKQGQHELDEMNVDATFIIKDTFNSARNIDLIQRWTIKEVLKKTKILIPYQKIEHILPVMHNIYDLYGQNLPFALKEQIYELDYKVVSTLVSTIIPEMVSRFRYIEASNSANFIELPKYMGSRGQRALPSTMST